MSTPPPDVTLQPGQTLTVAVPVPAPGRFNVPETPTLDAEVREVQAGVGTAVDGQFWSGSWHSTLTFVRAHQPPPPPPAPVTRPLLGEGAMGSPVPFETQLGRHVEVNRDYYQAGQSASAARQIADDVLNHRLPLLSTKFANGTAGWARISAAVNAGQPIPDADLAWIRAWATMLLAAKTPVWLILSHEPENDGGSAAAFRVAVKAVVTEMRRITGQDGLVRYGICLMAFTANGHGKPDDWYPGDGVLDFYAWDGYAGGISGAPYDGRSFAQVFGKPIAASHGLPVVIAEVGIPPDGPQAQWLADAVDWSRGRIAAIAYWNNKEVTLGPAAVAQFAKEMALG